MPRQSSSTRSSSSNQTLPRPMYSQSYPRPTNPPVQLPAPKLWHQAPQTNVSMIQTMKEGFGFGVGSSIAHRVVGGILGSSQSTVSPPPPSPTPYPYPREYAQCILENEKNPNVCQPFLGKDKSIWKECMESSAYDAELCKGVN